MKLFKALSLALAMAHIAESFTEKDRLAQKEEKQFKIVIVDSRAF